MPRRRIWTRITSVPLTALALRALLSSAPGCVQNEAGLLFSPAAEQQDRGRGGGRGRVRAFAESSRGTARSCAPSPAWRCRCSPIRVCDFHSRKDENLARPSRSPRAAAGWAWLGVHAEAERGRRRYPLCRPGGRYRALGPSGLRRDSRHVKERERKRESPEPAESQKPPGQSDSLGCERKT